MSKCGTCERFRDNPKPHPYGTCPSVVADMDACSAYGPAKPGNNPKCGQCLTSGSCYAKCSAHKGLTPRPEIDAPTRRAAGAWQWAQTWAKFNPAKSGACPGHCCDGDLRFIGLSALKTMERIVNMSKDTGWDLTKAPFGGSSRDDEPDFKPTPVEEVKKEAELIRKIASTDNRVLKKVAETGMALALAIKAESLPQGTKLDEGKPRWLLLMEGCKDALRGAVDVLMFGASKGYNDHNWKRLKNAQERITDSLYRHLDDLREGKELDEESGKPVIDHVLTNALFLSQLYHESKKK